MGAVAGRIEPERLGAAALAAGCDMLLVCQSLDVARRAIHGIEQAVLDGTLPPARLTEAVGRIQTLRRSIPARRGSPRLGWPAHERLARRLQLSSVR
jgi:beta-glucosidase-like glycosyl hydrolase